VQESGVGYVTRFEVKKSFMDKYEIHKVGGSNHTEWWIPAEKLEEPCINVSRIVWISHTTDHKSTILSPYTPIMFGESI